MEIIGIVFSQRGKVNKYAAGAIGSYEYFMGLRTCIFIIGSY